MKTKLSNGAPNYAKYTLEELREELESRTREEVIEQLSRINGTVDSVVRQSAVKLIAGALGFRPDSWGNWEYQDFERTELSKRLSLRATEEAEKLLPEVLGTLKAKIRASAIKSAQAAYEEAFSNKVNELLYERAAQAADEAAENEMGRLLHKLNEERGKR
jgi:hypothetical protein